MAVRSIKFRLIVPRGNEVEAARARRALGATHVFVNRATAFYERLLLEMRQGPVVEPCADGSETLVPAAHHQLATIRALGRCPTPPPLPVVTPDGQGKRLRRELHSLALATTITESWPLWGVRPLQFFAQIFAHRHLRPPRGGRKLLI